jgi:hypothetical protein
MTGLSITIYRPDFGKSRYGGDCSNGGATSPTVSQDKILVLFDENITDGNYRLENCRDDDRFICLKVVRRWEGTPSEYLHVEPMFDKDRGEGVGPMAGGNYVGTSDSRFRGVASGLLPVHDRWETQEQYNLLSS